MKILKVIAAAAAAILISAAPASAASVHLKGGKNAEPTFTDLGLSLQAYGELSGLGNGDVVIKLDATAQPTSTCGNPGSNTWQAPGQNPAEVDVTGAVGIPGSDIKNGNLAFTVRTVAPSAQVAGAPDCPNSSWTELITDLSFKTGTITVYQPSVLASDGSIITLGPLVFTVTCTFNPWTSNGLVPANTVTCS
jgi:hypothetical protein